MHYYNQKDNKWYPDGYDNPTKQPVTPAPYSHWGTMWALGVPIWYVSTATVQVRSPGIRITDVRFRALRAELHNPTIHGLTVFLQVASRIGPDYVNKFLDTKSWFGQHRQAQARQLIKEITELFQIDLDLDVLVTGG